jgi:chaperonin cofactor prefoldin
MSISGKRKIILKKLTGYNTVWHPESTVVFKSEKERIVIGRFVDKELIPLDQECLELCDEWSFKPDESLLDEDDTDDVKENVDDLVADVVDEHFDDVKVSHDVVDVIEHVDDVKVSHDVVDVVSLSDIKIIDSSNRKIIKSLTDTLFNDIFSKVIDNLQDKIDCLTLELTNANTQISQKTSELSLLQEKHDIMDQKFKAMKSLFS